VRSTPWYRRRHDNGIGGGGREDGAVRRVGFVVIAVVLFLVLSQRPAAAHGAGGIVATNFEVTVDGITPPLPGVRVRAIEAGSRLELRNDGPEVVVLGDRGEPYLRVGPDGTFENRRSPTADLNRRSGHGPAPTAPEPASTEADWRKLSDAPVARWHHHGTHWEGPRNPPEVESRPGERHVVYPRWEIGLQRGADRAAVFGKLTWVPGPSPAPWFGLMAFAFLAVGALGLLRRWGPPLAVATAVILGADVVHAFSVAFAFAGGLGSHLAKVVTGSFYAILGWGLAGLAIRLLRRSKVDGLYAGVFAGLSIAVFGGLLDIAKLSRSVSLSVLSIDLARLLVAVSAGGGLGLAAACLLVIQRTPDARRVVGGDPGEDGADEMPADDDDEAAAPQGGVHVGDRPEVPT
jgi:hypothetical protein